MIAFSRLDRMISQTIDRTVSDGGFRLTPMIQATPNAAPAIDGSRTVIEGTATLSYQADEAGMQLGVRRSYREGNDFRNTASGRDPFASIDRKFFPSLEDEPKAGDKFEMLDLEGLTPFKVTDVQRDGMSRLIIKLVHLGGQA